MRSEPWQDIATQGIAERVIASRPDPHWPVEEEC